MRILKLQDNNHYYCHLKKLVNVFVDNIYSSELPNLIVVKRLDDKEVINAYANNLVTTLS